MPLKAFADENKRFRTTSQLDERPTERTDNRRSNILADNARTRGLFVAHGVFVPVEREQSSGAIRARPVGVRGLRTRLSSPWPLSRLGDAHARHTSGPGRKCLNRQR